MPVTVAWFLPWLQKSHRVTSVSHILGEMLSSGCLIRSFWASVVQIHFILNLLVLRDQPFFRGSLALSSKFGLDVTQNKGLLLCVPVLVI